MSENHINGSLQNEFLNLLHARNGHFKLESGHHGNLWLDLDLLFLHPGNVQAFMLELARKLSAFEIDAVCGPMVGGALIAQSIAAELGVEFFYTERIAAQSSETLYSTAYQVPARLRKVIHGKNVAVVDDVINAGSAIRGTLLELQSLGIRPVVIGALLILGDVGQKYLVEGNFPLKSIAHLPNEIWTPEDCPLCASGIALDTAA